MDASDPTSAFAELVAAPIPADDALERALLLVAAHARADLSVGDYLRTLDALAAACPASDVDAVVRHVFVTEGFLGNRANYYDARNSYLDAVIDRRIGIPITLATVLIAVARRVGVHLEGVSMPGHFLVRVPGTQPRYLDPFAGGDELTLAECEERFRAVHGAAVPFDAKWLEPVGTVAIVARVLANLREIHMTNGDTADLEWVLRLRALLPGVSVEDRVDHAGVLAAIGRFDAAAHTLDEVASNADTREAAELRGRAARFRARLN